MIKHGLLDVLGLGSMARMTEWIAKVFLAKMRCLFIVWCHYSCLVTIALYAYGVIGPTVCFLDDSHEQHQGSIRLMTRSTIDR